MKDVGKPDLKEGESIKTRGKGYNPSEVVDITDMDSQLICRVYNYNGRIEEISKLIRQLFQEKY